MFKIKQKIELDKNYNVIRCEEYQDNKLIYWENNTYNYKNQIIGKETEDGYVRYESYPHRVKFKINPDDSIIVHYQPLTVVQNITVNLSITPEGLINNL